MRLSYLNFLDSVVNEIKLYLMQILHYSINYEKG